ncbi:MAG: alpha/beta fold hydrolase [Planctomycetes bacterium]|nr:alpha/beta fold hydrolase [Planctomycetota bacterium]
MHRSSRAGVVLAVVALLAVPGRTQEKAAPAVDLEKRATEFVDRLIAGNWTAATERFDATMRKEAPADRLAEIWKSIGDRVGVFRERLGTRREQVKDYRFVFVACRFEKATVDLKVVFNAAGEIAGFFLQPHQDPAAYEAPAYVRREAFREVECEFGEARWRLPGTLALPEGDGPFAAVVLVHGSGPNDRNETVGPNQPFKDLAWGLASRGIAVLRYEKRTRIHGAEMAGMTDLTVKEETVDDALLAVAWLRARSDIDAARVFVLGHSLGGMLVPRIGARTRDVAGYIVLAGPTRPMDEVILAQYRYIFSLDGAISADDKKQLEELKAQVERVKDPDLAPDAPREGLPLGVPAPYWLDLRGYQPAEAARALDRPMLVLQGERDYQVTMADFAGWKSVLGDRKDVVLRSFPALNHLFMAGEGRSTPTEYQKPGHVDEAVIAAIADWIRTVE